LAEIPSRVRRDQDELEGAYFFTSSVYALDNIDVKIGNVHAW
jgi:hypothetical protein